jgi:Cu/Ag efflux pump CusA
MFGFSSIYVIFNERTDFYESRSRILENLRTDRLHPADAHPPPTAGRNIVWKTQNR